MGDLDVVADDLLEISEGPEKEGQVQMVNFIGKIAKKSRREEKRILMALSFMGEVIANQCRLKLKENQVANLIAEKATLAAQEANKIR